MSPISLYCEVLQEDAYIYIVQDIQVKISELLLKRIQTHTTQCIHELSNQLQHFPLNALHICGNFIITFMVLKKTVSLKIFIKKNPVG